MRFYFKLKNLAWRQLSFQFHSFLLLPFSFKKNWVKKESKKKQKWWEKLKNFHHTQKRQQKTFFFFFESNRVESRKEIENYLFFSSACDCKAPFSIHLVFFTSHSSRLKLAKHMHENVCVWLCLCLYVERWNGKS